MESALALGVLGGLIGTIAVVAVIIYVLLIVANWKIFKKAGEGGWKSLIPVYNSYILYKISWKPAMFWVTLLLSIAASVLTNIEDNNTCLYIGGALGVVLLVISLIQIGKLSKAFGHGFWFAVGLLFLPNIFTMVLGFGGSKYLGPQ